MPASLNPLDTYRNGLSAGNMLTSKKSASIIS
jgi:hypothetical protein